MPAFRDIAIIGGGFSGTLMALNLTRFDGPRTTLIERAPHQLGRGLAFSTPSRSHLLNVRASNMGAFPDRPGDFAAWLHTQGEEAPQFAERLRYGDYLAALLQEASQSERLTVRQADVVDLEQFATHILLHYADGSTHCFDAAVIAAGNLPPHTPEPFQALIGSDIYAPDPWAASATRNLGPDDTVMLVGTGLTAVDVALTLDAQGFAGEIIAYSRRGLIPQAHDPSQHAKADPANVPAENGSHLVHVVRKRARDVGWRNAIDELRPHTKALWQRENDAGRDRFLRHLRPYWDVHRHRLAPGVAASINRLRKEGRIRFVGGEILSISRNAAQADIVWRQRYTNSIERAAVARVINCTGPQGDIERTSDPLLRKLVERGTISPDRARLGIDVTSQAHSINRSGIKNDRLFAVGPMTRGSFWEITAVPDIRHQTWDLARWLSAAHWVEGEGL